MRTVTRRRSASVLDEARRRFAASWLGAALAGCLLAVLPIDAGQVRTVNLEELTTRADRIFAGRCLETRIVAHAQLGSVTRVTFEVERAIKGDLGKTLTIEIMGVGAGHVASGLAALDVPRFASGERVVLFLYADSALGLTSPVALGQGKFSVLRDKHGQEFAVNALGNRNLLRGLSAGARERVGTSLLRWDEKPGLPPEALLDGVQELLKPEGRTPPTSAGRRAPTGGRR